MLADRRGLLRLAAATAAGAWLPRGSRAQPRWGFDPFSLGVASGSPTPDGLVLWTRLLPPGLFDRLGDAPVPVRWVPLQACTVLGSAGQLQQVMMNLLQNAFDALSAVPEPMVWVEMGCKGDPDQPTVRVTVRDNGPGIPPEHLLRIFDPFFTTKPVGKGTGLGLSLSYGIVKRHGGTLVVRSQPGRGACFRVTLPVRQARAPAAVAVS